MLRGHNSIIMLKREIDFYKYRFYAYLVSILFIAISVVIGSSRGINYGIDFKGGALFEVRVLGLEISDVRSAFIDSEFEAFQVQTVGSEGIDYMIKLKLNPQISGVENIELVKDSITNLLGGDIEFRKVDFVGPKIGSSLVKKSLFAVFASLFGMLIYVGARFSFSMSIAAIAALLHDVLAVFCFYIITQIEFNTSSVAVMLIILGYSINDTVVIFDRVRENKRKFNFKTEIDLINSSINQTLRRTMITSFTTLIVTVALAILGGESLRGFSYALCFGIVVGTYSTIFIASSLYNLFRILKIAGS